MAKRIEVGAFMIDVWMPRTGLLYAPCEIQSTALHVSPVRVAQGSSQSKRKEGMVGVLAVRGYTSIASRPPKTDK